MAAADLPARPWALQRNANLLHGPAIAPSSVQHESGPSDCPVCQKPHGARLVRRLTVGPAPEHVWKGAEDFRSASRYYPPPVPVLANRSSPPIGRSTRWSVALA